jgi:hypothetical protein
MEATKEAGGACPLHDQVITELKTDMVWVKKSLHDQSTHLWGITCGIALMLIKVLLFS